MVSISEPSKTGKEMVRVDTSGIMASFSRENGKKGRRTDMVFGNLQTAILTSAIG